MKSPQILIILTVLLLTMVQGCGKSDNPENISTAVTENTTATDSKPNDTAIEATGMTEPDSNDKAANEQDNGFIEIALADGNYIFYGKGFEPVLKIVIKSGEERVICNNLPSVPSVSPDGKRVAYLSPFEWEVLSNVHIYDIAGNSDEIALSTKETAENEHVREQYTPKMLAWLDDRYLLLVIQFAYGTVTQGGDLYAYDTREASLQPLSKLFQKEEITGIKVDQDIVYLDFIEYIDNSMKEYQQLKKAIKSDQIYEAIRNGELIDHFIMAEDLSGVLEWEDDLEKYEFDDKAPFVELSADLNGDGKKDNIKYQIADNNVFILKVNNLEIKSYGDNLADKPYVVDINKQDGIKELAVQEFGPSSDERTYFFYYTGTELRFMGKLRELCSEKGYIKGDGKVISTIRPLLLQTWFLKKEYRLDGEHLLEGIKSDLYPANYTSETLTLKTSLKLFEKPKNNNVLIEINAGDKLKLLGSDGIEWCYAEAKGIKGWFSVDGFTMRENGLYVGEVFDGLCNAD